MTGRETRTPSQQQGLPSEPVWLNMILVQQKSSLSLYRIGMKGADCNYIRNLEKKNPTKCMRILLQLPLCLQTVD